MQLVYLYIDEYCNFSHAGFNFSPDVRLCFDAVHCVVTVSDAQSCLPEGFWGENINSLSAVVGNNGAGKTSLMQCIIELFLDAHGNKRAGGQGILIFGEGDTLYGYCGGAWEKGPIKTRLDSGKYRRLQWLCGINAGDVLSQTKLIYLTNVLTMRDSRRAQWYKSSRKAPFYDCSAGNVFVSDAEKDVNQVSRSSSSAESMGLDSYFLYEQYKQIKFVFDKRQHRNCASLRDGGYPVPVPERLYIDLMLDGHLSTALEVDDILDDFVEYESFPEWEVEQKVFPDLYSIQEKRELGQCGPYDFLRKQLGRCAIWCAVRSAAALMNSAERGKLRAFLVNWDENLGYDIGIFQTIWGAIQKIKRDGRNPSEDWESLNGCRNYYIEFLNFIGSQALEQHFKIETALYGPSVQNSELDSITFSIDTSDDVWFMEFLQKYRYICNPDYFLDFHWRLSSGESSLLSLFASLYYIYGADYTNPKNGELQIWNSFPQFNEVPCDSVILLIDEADLTYHPEWQRMFIDLLTAFLPKVYPPQCCRDIQIILTTHSPVLLSDVPAQNAIYLKYDPETRQTTVEGPHQTGTFGQNIHLLYKDSFFLEHGTIGCFAHRKIEGLVKELEKIEGALEQGAAADPVHLADQLKRRCRPCAELIGEPIIRRKVLTWIDALEKKLPPDGQGDRIRDMTDAELERELNRLLTERDRRKHD